MPVNELRACFSRVATYTGGRVSLRSGRVDSFPRSGIEIAREGSHLDLRQDAGVFLYAAFDRCQADHDVHDDAEALVRRFGRKGPQRSMIGANIRIRSCAPQRPCERLRIVLESLARVSSSFGVPIIPRFAEQLHFRVVQ